MKKIKLLLFTAFISSFLFTSCNEIDSGEALEGSEFISSPIIVGWAETSYTESYFTDLGTLNNNYPLDILGGGDGAPTSSDISLNISINAETTATEGGEFSLPSTTATIPAGSSFAGVPIDVNTGSFNPGVPTSLVLDVTATIDGVVVSESSKQMRINFVGCKSALSGSTYNVQITRRETGQVTNRSGVSINDVSVNNFQTTYVGAWPLTPGVRFEDICGKLYIVSHDLADTYSNQVTAAAGPNNLAGEVDENGNFTLTYNISLGAPWGDYDAVYTKI